MGHLEESCKATTPQKIAQANSTKMIKATLGMRQRSLSMYVALRCHTWSILFTVATCQILKLDLIFNFLSVVQKDATTCTLDLGANKQKLDNPDSNNLDLSD